MTTRPWVGLATCTQLPDLDEDGPALIAALAARGLSGVDVHGETSLLYLGGAYSHSVRKGPLLARGGAEVDGLYREESISARVPAPEELALAECVLQAVPGGPVQLLYARVDLLPGPDGSPRLLELELTEPSLFLAHDPGAAERFAAAIASAVDSARGAATP